MPPSRPQCPMIAGITFCAVSCRLSFPSFHLRARHYPRCPDLYRCRPRTCVKAGVHREALVAPTRRGTQRCPKRPASSRWLSWVQLSGRSLASYDIGVGMADAALLLCGVPPKSHGVDDRSLGQTRRSAHKLKKLDGKPGRITNFWNCLRGV